MNQIVDINFVKKVNGQKLKISSKIYSTSSPLFVPYFGRLWKHHIYSSRLSKWTNISIAVLTSWDVNKHCHTFFMGISMGIYIN